MSRLVLLDMFLNHVWHDNKRTIDTTAIA